VALACSSSPGEERTSASAAALTTTTQGTDHTAATAPTAEVAQTSTPENVVANATLVWTEKLSDVHTVDFYQQSPSGTALIVEHGQHGVHRLVKPILAKHGFGAVFLAIQPNATVPAPLAAADALAASLKAAVSSDAGTSTLVYKPLPASAPTKGTLAVSGGGIVEPLTAAQSSAWVANTCKLGSAYNEQVCEPGYTWATTGVSEPWDTGLWSAATELGSEATSAATFTFQAWTCWASGFLNLGTTCGWNTLVTQSIQPGWWWSWSNGNNGTNSQFSASISSPNGTNGNATVDVWDEYAQESSGSSGPPPSCSSCESCSSCD
jgi:hypothetical protein